MKKTLLCGLALFFASSAFAQTTAITFPAPGQTMNVGGCTFSGVTVLSINASQSPAVTANGTVQSGCTTGSSGGGATSTVGVSLRPSSYTIGDTNAADFPIITWSSADTGVTCAAMSTSIPAGFTAVPASSSPGSGTITLQPVGTPVANPAYSVTVQCSTTTASTTVSPSTSNLSLAVSSASSPGACSASQTSTTFSNGAVLQRQCSGTANFGTYHPNQTYNFVSLDTLFQGTFGNYAYSGLTFVPTITSGQYISLAFTPTTISSLQLGNNITYGIGGLITLSTTPGDFAPANPACMSSKGGLNIATGVVPYWCSISLNTTYYVNFAAVNPDGSQACNRNLTSCAAAYLAYHIQ